MKLVFLKYNPYDDVDPVFPANGAVYNYIIDPNNKSSLPDHFFQTDSVGFCKTRVTPQWDSTCRPDPDFHPKYPSTGLCRNRHGNAGIQNYLNSLTRDDLVFYFYKNNKGHIVISAVFNVKKLKIPLTNEKKAFDFYTTKVGANNIPYNIVTSKPPLHPQPLNKTSIINPSHYPHFTECIYDVQTTKVRGLKNKQPCPACTHPIHPPSRGYYLRAGMPFVVYKWYCKKFTNAVDLAGALNINPITTDRFFEFLRNNFARTTAMPKLINGVNQVVGTVLFSKKNSFNSTQSGGMVIDITSASSPCFYKYGNPEKKLKILFGHFSGGTSIT
jgi:hypothetical protein